MEFNQSLSVTKRIEVNRNKLWEFISSPGYLNYCHPFCKKNKIIKWEKDNHSDMLEYLNGLVYIRNFIKWDENKGYTLLIGEKNKEQSKVIWEIIEDGNSNYLKITVFPYFLKNYPRVISYFPYKFFVAPKLRSYLKSVLNGINFYLINEVPVKRNKYGKHLWFS